MGRREAIGIRDEANDLPVIAVQSDNRNNPPVPVSGGSPGNDDAGVPDQEIVDEIEPEPLPKISFEPSSPLLICEISTNSCLVNWDPFNLANIDPPILTDDLSPRYTLSYLLELREVIAKPASNGNKNDATKQENAWVILHQGSSTAHQVHTLRPGRTYDLRVRCIVDMIFPECELLPVAPTDTAQIQTIPTPPISPQPPQLSSKTRNSLKVKWSVPDETGGRAILCYRLQMCTVPPGQESVLHYDEAFSEVYCGEDRTFKVTGLRPGLRYGFKIMATNEIGSSPFSPCSVFTTQASVPAVITTQQQISRTATSVGFRWSPPEDNGAPLSCYVMERDDGQGGDFHVAYSGMQPQCTIADLKSGLPYRFRVRADNSEGRGNWSTPFTATTAALPPNSPRPPALIGANRTSATVSWAAPEEDGGSPVTGYQVEIRAKTRIAVQQLGNEWLLVYEGPATAHTIHSLEAGCSYMCRVRAVNSVGPGQYSPATEVQAAAGVPHPPSNPQPASCSTHSLLIQWDPPLHDGGSEVSSYRLEMSASTSPSDEAGPSTSYDVSRSLNAERAYSCVYSGEECTAEVVGLAPGRDYLFRVTALNSQGGSDYSPTALLTTQAAVPLSPPPPTSTSTSSTGVSLQWWAPDGQGAVLTGYVVETARVEEGGEVDLQNLEGEAGKWHFSPSYRGQDTQCEVRGLEPFTQYLARVRASNTVGAGPWSVPCLYRTQPAAPSAPCQLKARGTSSTSISLSWTPPAKHHGAPVTSYILELAPARTTTTTTSSKSAAAPWTRSWQGSETTCHIHDFPPGRTYNFRVKAINARGTGPPSDISSAATLPSVPDSPDKLSISQRTATSIRLKWSPPLEENGAAVDFCVLEMAGVDGEYRVLYQGQEQTYRVNGLQPMLEYSFRVAAVNIAGQGPYCPAVTVKTMMLPPQPPQDVDVQPVLGGGGGEVEVKGLTAELTVRWEPPVSAPQCAGVLSYEVEAAVEAEHGAAEGQVWKQTVQQRTSECRIVDLPCGTAFSVRMRAVGVEGSGHSLWTPTVRVVTPGSKATELEHQSGGHDAAGAGAAARKRTKGKPKGKAHATAGEDTPTHTSTSTATPPAKQSKGALTTSTAVAKGPPKKLVLGFISPKVLRLAKKFIAYVLLTPVLLFLLKLVIEEFRSKGTRRY